MKRALIITRQAEPEEADEGQRRLAQWNNMKFG